MRLSDLIPELPDVVGFQGDTTLELAGVAHDSRRVRPGDLFCCIVGGTFDGHEFAEDAVRQGTAALLVQGAEGMRRVPRTVPAVAVEDTRLALAAAAASVYGHPSRELRLVGITGTNGKTSTCYLVESIARAAGTPTGLMTTLEVRIGPGRSAIAAHTTPEASDLQGALRAMADAGAKLAAMEVSSHALALHRVDGCEFACVAFSNLSHDHLDFHHTPEEYYAAKRTLFTKRFWGESPFHAVINSDDPWGQRLCAEAEGYVLRVGASETADIHVIDSAVRTDGTDISLVTPVGRREIHARLRGLYTVANVALASGIAFVMGFPLDTIVAGVEDLECVPGRLEPVGPVEGKPLVLVDYAHSPDGLRNVLSSVRAMMPRQVIVVFGCGGDRDRAKRPEMGAIAAELADRVILTSDNPRSEDPSGILDEIAVGMRGASFERIADRREAVFRAVGLGSPGDIVLIAGKGHETYQIFRDRTIDFDDRQVSREALGIEAEL